MVQNKNKYYLGIDWGLNRTGIAIADDELQIATVLKEVATSNLIEEIKKLQAEYGINKIIFGELIFSNQFNQNNAGGNKIENEKKQCLQKIKELGIKVRIAEEMLTTKIGQQNLLESGKKKVSKQDNGEAAKIILQGWLDQYHL